MNSVKKAFWVLKDKKLQLFFMVMIILVGSLLELLGVTAILPFINVALNPEMILENKYLYFFYSNFSFSDASSYLIFLGCVLIFIYIIKNIYVIAMNNYIYRFAYHNQKELACRLFTVYLSQPYSYFSERNSASFVRNLNEDTILFFETIIACLQFVAEVMVCALLGLTLLIMDPMLTIGVVTVMILFILTVFRFLKRSLEKKGAQCRGYRAEMYKWILQATGGIKETKILEKENFFLGKFTGLYTLFAEDYRRYKMFAFLPRPLMEAVSICTLLLIVIVKMINGADISYFLPILSVFAVAVFRMLPSFNRLSSYVSLIMFNKASVESIYNDITTLEKLSKNGDDTKVIDFKDEIRLEGVSFRYPNAEEDVLDDMELSIPRGKSVAFIGASGAGKTTLADIILGIQPMSKGSMTVDGISVDPMSIEWHKKVGYIPQSIFLMDDTIRNNIAFGVPEELISDEQIEKVLEEAQIKEFIDSLPDGINTQIGERGTKLSGGQRQRIGIARALYFNPELLVLDEATSALDNETEKAVMDAIDCLAGSKTLIIIAHRLSTIVNCNLVYEIKDGKAWLNSNE